MKLETMKADSRGQNYRCAWLARSGGKSWTRFWWHWLRPVLPNDELSGSGAIRSNERLSDFFEVYNECYKISSTIS